MRSLKPLCMMVAVLAAAVAFDVYGAWRLGLPSSRCAECGGAMVVTDDGVLQTHSCELCRYGTIKQVGANNGKWR